MSSQFEIRELKSNEVPAAARLMAAAYKDDPITAIVTTGLSEDRKSAFVTGYFRIIIHLAYTHGKTLVALSTGQMASLALYYLPDQYPPPFFARLATSLKLFCLIRRYANLRELMPLMAASQRLKQDIPQAPFLYTQITCTHPDFNGKGLGRQLTERILELADRQGLGSYSVTSNPANLGVWSRLGFAATRSFSVAGITYWSLWRPPHGVGSWRPPHEARSWHPPLSTQSR